jgi:hypothetical protein
VGLQQEIARADAYIAQTNRRIAKHHGLLRRSRDVQTIDITRDLLMVLAALRGNVENRRRWLQLTERPTSQDP